MFKNIFSLILLCFGLVNFAQETGINTTLATETLDVNGVARVRLIDEASVNAVKDSLLVVDGIGIVKRVSSSMIVGQKEPNSLILNTELVKSLSATNNIYYNLPLNSSNVQYLNNSFYNIVSDGKIEILQNGTYLVSGELSISNMPVASTKVVFAVFVNNTLKGYLGNSVANFSTVDGYSKAGLLMLNLSVADMVEIRYMINNNGTSLNSDFLNLGITKI